MNNFFMDFLISISNINNFNVSELHLQILKNVFKISQHHTNILFQTVELKIEQKKKILIQGFNDISYDYFSLKNEINERKIIWLRKKIKIVELKQNIINFLRNYDYSFNYISSKKVLELNFINEIIFLLFKYNYNRFQLVGETTSIVNSIQKELKNVLKF